MNKFLFFCLFISYFTIICSLNTDSKIKELEKNIENSGKLLQDFILYFDKRIVWLEENFKGMYNNYSICCSNMKNTEFKLHKIHTLVNYHFKIKDEF